MARRPGVAALAVAALTALGAAGCSPSAIIGGKVTDAAGDGGTLTLLSATSIASLDPQRVADPVVASMVGRTLHRTLTAYAPLTGDATQPELVGDLAKDTGEPSEDLRTWTFTLRPGLTWQDGSPLTCEDVRHGIARTFATDTVTGGSTDALSALAIPRSPDGHSTFRGPWAQGPEADAGRSAFDQAVTCREDTITFLLSGPIADFNEMVTLPAFAPVKKDGDTGPDSGAALVSSGPYRLDGTWDPVSGGILVRNEKWAKESDVVRRAHPDRIRVSTGQEAAVIAGTVLADQNPNRGSVSLMPAPPALQQQISAVPALRDRSVSVPTGVVDYLAPSVGGAAFATKDVRAAFAASTNRAGYAAGLATPLALTPTASIIPSGLLARATTAVEVPPADPARSRELLAAAGATVPVPIKVAYRSGVASDKAMAALVAGWRAGGFEPTLVPIADAYYATIAAPGAAAQYDVFWSNWSPAWGSASTILPALFDSSVNVSSAGSGRDYGGWSNADWNAKVPVISGTPERAAREKAWAEADDALLDDVAYVALVERSAVHLAGSDVRGLAAQPHGGGAIDLAVAGVDS